MYQMHARHMVEKVEKSLNQDETFFISLGVNEGKESNTSPLVTDGLSVIGRETSFGEDNSKTSHWSEV